ncbi:MAG: class I SAM-dependent RNA methyltransferase [Thermodesulfobacteriota bacterium]
MTRDVRGSPPSPVTRHPSLPLSLFAVSPPGFEDLVEAELAALGLRGERGDGGVAFSGTWRDAWRANLWSRVASRVLVRVGAFEARGFRELERALGNVPWGEWLPPGCAVDVRAASHRSRLWHTGKVAEVVMAALGASVGARPEKGESALRLMVRAVDRAVTVSLDTSGEHLHRRGYRPRGGRAPIRENLAAGLLVRAGWSGGEPFLDPLCGSGTLAVEAALLGLGAAPGLRRGFAFESFPSFDPSAWDGVRDEAREVARERPPAPVFASDRDAGQVQLLAAAARAAGVADHLQVAVADVGELAPPDTGRFPGGLVAANPPYGHRLGGREAACAALGRALRGPFRAWRWALVLSSPGAERALGLRPEAVYSFRSGGLPVRWGVGRGAGTGSREGPTA